MKSLNEGIISRIRQASSVNPKRHPLRYLSHKYWARKPYNVVRYHIEHFTEKGDTVLDPFGGSGVTAFESLAIGRKVYTIDLNPVAIFISNQVVRTDIDLDEFERKARMIIKETADQTEWVYSTECPTCGLRASIISTVYVKDLPKTLFVICENSGKVRLKNPDHNDIALTNQISEMKLRNWYPTASLPRNADVERVDQLFYRRNLYVLSELYDRIIRERNENIRDLLKYTFTANLATVSKLIPVNRKRWEKGILPSGMWSIKRYWTPPTRVENNVLYYFKKRLQRTLEAKKETYNILGETRFYENYFSYTASATNMSMIDEATIDYVFTDPPFGRNVEYFNLSTMWAAWLKMELDYSNELITDFSDKSLAEYGRKLKDAFSEIKRVLKDERVVSLAFNNRSLKVWQVLMDAVTSSGLRLIHIIHQPPAELSFTQMKMHKKAGLRGHFVYHFLKTSEVVKRKSIDANEVEAIILPIVTRLIEEKGGLVVHEIYSSIMPILVNKYRIRNIDALEKGIDSILNSHFVCEEEEVLIWRRGRYIKIGEYVWRPTGTTPQKNLDEDKVRKLIRRYLGEMNHSDLNSLTSEEIYEKIFRQKWRGITHPQEFDRLPCLPKSKTINMIEDDMNILRGELTKFF